MKSVCLRCKEEDDDLRHGICYWCGKKELDEHIASATELEEE